MSSRERREIREHVAKVAAMEEQVAALERRNAELREEFDKMDVWHSRELLASEAENEKLRELVHDMWHEGAFEPGAYCAEAAPRLEERTRELGIEVW